MGSVTKSQVYSANATALGDLAAPTTKLATTVTGSANKVHGTVFGLAWHGTGKRAAEGRADLELAQDKRVADVYDSLANAFTSGHAAMQPMIESLTRTGHSLEADSFSVSETWKVTDLFDYGAGDQSLKAAGFSEDQRREIIDRVRNERSNTAVTETSNLLRLASDLALADQHTADAIAKAQADLGTAAPTTAGLRGGTQAGDDLAAVAAGHADPAALARVRAAANLTPAQLDALRQGKPASMPQGQYDYLKSLMSAQNGTSMHAINEALKKYPGLQGAMADAYEVIGNPNISTAIGDHGGMQNEPLPLQNALTGQLWKPFGNKPNSGGVPMVPTRALGAFNDIMDHGNPAVRVGSDVDRASLNQASKIADLIDRGHAVATDQPVTNAKSQYSSIADESGLNKLIDKMVTHAAPDHQAVNDFLVGADNGSSPSSERMASATSNTFEGDKSFLHLVTHKFDPGQHGVNDMFDWIGASATSPGHEGLTAAASANALAHLLSENSKTLGEDMPGAHNLGGSTLGLANHELVQTMTKNLIPYLGNLVGVDVPGINAAAIPGFDNTSQMADMVKVLTSDPASAMAVNRAAAGFENYFSHEYGVSGDSQYARAAGQLVHSIKDGDASALEVYRANKNWDNIRSFNHEGAQWDTAKAILGTGLGYAGPLGPLMSKGLDIMNPTMKLDALGLVGDPSTMSNDAWQRAVTATQAGFGQMVDGNYRQYNMLDGYLSSHPDVIARFQQVSIDGRLVNFVDDHGNVDWSSMVAHQSAFDLLFNTLPLKDWDSTENGFNKGLQDTNINPEVLARPSDGSTPPRQPR